MSSGNIEDPKSVKPESEHKLPSIQVATSNEAQNYNDHYQHTQKQERDTAAQLTSHPIYQQILRQQQNDTQDSQDQLREQQQQLQQLQQLQLQEHQQPQHNHYNPLQSTGITATTFPSPDHIKPAVGTEEWHRIRKTNHREVERRRRENINVGITELSQLLPKQDSNKLQILRNAVEYIKRLKENENNNIEKWTLEKLLTDQAVSELATSNEKLKEELEKLYSEIEHWKKIASGKSS